MIAFAYDGPVTFLARAAIFATFVVLVGGWLLAFGLRGFYAVRTHRRRRRRGGYVDVTGYRAWDDYPCEFDREWRRGA